MSYPRVGDLSPNQLILNLTPEVAADLDLSTVLSATMDVQKPDSADGSDTWTASMSNQSATTLRLTHSYLAGELSAPGTYVVTAILTVAAGVHNADPVAVRVKGKYEL